MVKWDVNKFCVSNATVTNQLHYKACHCHDGKSNGNLYSHHTLLKDLIASIIISKTTNMNGNGL